MRLHFKEDPKEWRKTTLIGLIGPAVITGILRWRGVISTGFLGAVLAVIAVAAVLIRDARQSKAPRTPAP